MSDWKCGGDAPKDGTKVLFTNEADIQIQFWEKGSMFEGWATGTNNPCINRSYFQHLPSLEDLPF